jgi:hypothetical protein
VQSIVNINAPRLPFCEINSVIKEYKSIKDTAPVVYFAALFSLAPLGDNFDISKAKLMANFFNNLENTLTNDLKEICEYLCI